VFITPLLWQDLDELDQQVAELGWRKLT